jgi:hypothetical protein
MATVPANELIRRTIKTQEDDPRMPAILEDDAGRRGWAKTPLRQRRPKLR